MKPNLSAVKAPSRLARILSYLVVLAFLVSAVPQPALAATSATCSKSYTVVAGDTLSAIAAKYNTTVAILAELNGLKDPYVLTIGQKICLPSSATVTPTDTTTSKGKKLDFNVTRNGTRIRVDVSGGAANANYRVTAGPDRRFPQDWTRLGKVRVRKDVKGTAIFGLPQNLRDADFYVLCLKNMVTDDLVCHKIFQ